MKQLGLFNRYPARPGYQPTETSYIAAKSVQHEANKLQEACLKAIAEEPRTADEVASVVHRSVLAIRPRLSELFKMGKIEKSEEVRLNVSGKWAAVWRLKVKK